MSLKPFRAFVSVITAVFVFGCNGAKPLSPSRVVSLTVSIPPTNELKASLINSTSNEVLFRVDGPGMAPVTGKTGVFVSSAGAGSVDFTADIPAGPSRILAVQLNDGSTHQPLAVGATSIDLSSNTALTDVVVDMGSVTRNCYFTNEAVSIYGLGSSYTFSSDTLIYPNSYGYDIAFNCSAGPFVMQDAVSFLSPILNTIAYLGNGDLVNFASVPSASSFYPTSSQAKGGANPNLQAGDVYCVKLSSMTGYAWVQITDPGNMPLTGPSFRFRVNKTLTYYAYDQTAADLAGGCNTLY